MSRGQHEIHFEGAAIFTVEDDGFDFTFMLDITYHMTATTGGTRPYRIDREAKRSTDGAVHLEQR